MFSWSDLQPILPAISTFLIIGTMALGIIGLFTSRFVKRGRPTRSGWWVIAFMVLLGAATWIASTASRIADEGKERALTAERNARFTKEMGSLDQLQTKMKTTLARSAASQAAQRDLLGVANRNLNLSAALQAQNRADTVAVLGRAFREANRIAPERIAVSVDLNCQSPDENGQYPELAEVSLLVTPRGREQITLTSDRAIRIGSKVIFQDLQGAIGPLDTFEAWRTARTDVWVKAVLRPGSEPSGRAAEQPQGLTQAGSSGSSAICSADTILLLNGREVLQAEPFFERSLRGDYYAMGSNYRADRAAFPRF